MAQTDAPADDRSDSAERYVCEECREPIEEEASTCPHCGHDPTAAGRMWAGVFALFGLLSSLTIVGAIIGLPLFAVALILAWRTDEATPAVAA